MYRDEQLFTSYFEAIGIDLNDDWWPIAWAVTEAESYAQWKLFIDYLQEDLELTENSPTYVFMSDQQKGLSKVILENFPQSERRSTSQPRGSSQMTDDSNRVESSNARQNQENNLAGPRSSRWGTTSNPQRCGRRKDKD
ncbi:hypothetical protein AAHA92_02373 [Salvia divinorum]|uniref:MULE transposase domain-containing protein n=1 Tax=Salvia divinorum TaxID=28513 RepID=A0ABD1IEG0_SALDI